MPSVFDLAEGGNGHGLYIFEWTPTALLGETGQDSPEQPTATGNAAAVAGSPIAEEESAEEAAPSGRGVRRRSALASAAVLEEYAGNSDASDRGPHEAATHFADDADYTEAAATLGHAPGPARAPPSAKRKRTRLRQTPAAPLDAAEKLVSEQQATAAVPLEVDPSADKEARTIRAKRNRRRSRQPQAPSAGAASTNLHAQAAISVAAKADAGAFEHPNQKADVAHSLEVATVNTQPATATAPPSAKGKRARPRQPPAKFQPTFASDRPAPKRPPAGHIHTSSGSTTMRIAATPLTPNRFPRW